jgi:hypothetical protein
MACADRRRLACPDFRQSVHTRDLRTNDRFGDENWSAVAPADLSRLLQPISTDQDGASVPRSSFARVKITFLLADLVRACLLSSIDLFVREADVPPEGETLARLEATQACP